MTLQNLASPIVWPFPPTDNSTPGLLSNNLIDADGEYYGYVFQVSPVDDGKSLDEVTWRTGTVTTGGDLDVRIETVDGSGNPSGTLATTNSNLVVSVASGDDDTFFTSALTASHTVSAGEMLAVIVERPTSSTFNGNLASYRRAYSGGDLPYEVYNTGSDGKNSMTQGSSPQPPVMSVHYSDGTFAWVPPAFPFDALSVETWTSSGVERGMRFQVPFKAGCCGCWIRGGGTGTGGDYRVTLYDASGVPNDTDSNRLANIAMDDEHSASDTGDPKFIMFDTVVTLSASTTYRLTVDATTANNFSLYYFDVPSAALMAAAPGGASWHYTLDNGAGGWTDTTTRRPHMGLIFSSLDDGAGGAGGSSTSYIIGG